MSSRLHRIRTLVGHEYRAALGSRLLLSLLAILVTVTVVSVYIAAVDYRSQLADYELYRAAARAHGISRVAPAPLALLSLLRGSLEYLEIIGAVVAIALGYLSVSRERVNRTLPLLRSRPVTSGEQAAGAALGAVAVIGTLVLVTSLVAVVCLGVIGHAWVDGAQVLRLLLAYFAGLVYLVTFFCLGAVVTARSRVAANGLMIALGVWVLVVLILPQIGDTLDADNQVPGGLFAALGLGHSGEVAILKHFALYEHIRTGIEEASFTKHFERFAFAMTDVKERYRSMSLSQLLWEKRNDIGWLTAYPIVLAVALWRGFHRQPTIPDGGQS